jgi:YHS domain-containing protein
MKQIITIALLVIGYSISAQSIDYNLSKKGYVAEGYDVVAYFSQSAKKGSKKYNTEHDGVQYLFSSQENLDTFNETPEKFVPKYGGYCAYAIGAKGIKVDIDPKTFEIRDGELYLFYNSWGNNTLETWLNGPTEDLKAVINTTLKETIQSALKIVYPAAIAEVILVLIALYANATLLAFIDHNIWVQYSIVVILLVLGAYLFFKKNKEMPHTKRKLKISKPLLGFILGMVNPAVLMYWLVAITFLNKKIMHLDLSINDTLLLLFLIGVFFGKVVTLYGFGKFSHQLSLKTHHISTKVNQIIGVLLAIVSIVQFIKLVYV